MPYLPHVLFCFSPSLRSLELSSVLAQNRMGWGTTMNLEPQFSLCLKAFSPRLSSPNTHILEDPDLLGGDCFTSLLSPAPLVKGVTVPPGLSDPNPWLYRGLPEMEKGQFWRNWDPHLQRPSRHACCTVRVSPRVRERTCH